MTVSVPLDIDISWRGVFRWCGVDTAFEVEDAVPVAPGRSAREQIAMAREMLGQLGGDARIVGALPFDLATTGSLWVGSPTPLAEPRSADIPAKSDIATPVFTPAEQQDYEDTVRSALAAIARGELRKVVPARYTDVALTEPINVPALVARLATDPVAVGFAARTVDGFIVGASPELLVARRSGTVTSRPLAGSRPRWLSKSDAGAALHGSVKEQEEHRIVVDEIAEILRNASRGSAGIDGPYLLSTRRVWHLATDISTQMSDDLDALSIVELLQPTPAVCGVPREAALRFLKQHETIPRGLYAGAVGWQDCTGDGEWRVTVRCGLVQGRSVRVFAGAGVVTGSIPETEFLETTVKMQTLYDAL